MVSGLESKFCEQWLKELCMFNLKTAGQDRHDSSLQIQEFYIEQNVAAFKYPIQIESWLIVSL